MASSKPSSNFSRRPVRRLLLPKIGPLKNKGLFEEYFYALLAMIFFVVAILGKAGGMSAYNALLVGLWVTVFLWFARQLKLYFKERANPGPAKKSTRPARNPPAAGNGTRPPGRKPMIEPQWPLKSAKAPSQPIPDPGTPGNKKAFVYERPTLPDRKPKLPANWPGRHKKKPKP
jgi:hypothetical protein